MSSVLLSVGGIVLMGHGEGFENSSTLGILYAALAALMSAIFQVKKLIKDKFVFTNISLLFEYGNYILCSPPCFNV